MNGEVQNNVPADLEDSPFPLTDTDRWVLSQKDEDFHLHDWDELRKIIGKNHPISCFLIN